MRLINILLRQEVRAFCLKQRSAGLSKLVFSMTTMASTAETQESENPLLTFGIIADVQYADVDDGTDYSKNRKRYYRNSLNLLKNAVNDWKRCQGPLSFVLQLGDLIDGKSKIGGQSSSHKALNAALEPFNSLHAPVHHVLGNHDFYNFDRSFFLKSTLNSALNTDIQSGVDRFYYTFLPHPKLRIVMLDTYEISVLGYSDDLENENYKKGKALLQEHNPNSQQNETAGLEGMERRWAAFNGGVGDKQLQWLAQVLGKAQLKEENVIIVSHIGFHSSLPKNYSICLSWSCHEVMETIHQYGCVIGILAGHEHAGHQHLDEHGVQHISFQGVVETMPGSDAYATARLYDREIIITGVGRVPNFAIALKYPV